MSSRTASPQIERLQRPERERFFEEYVKRNTPVILQGVATEWPAMTKWTPEYLQSVAGDSRITVHFHEDGDFHDWYLHRKRRIDRQIPLAELLDLLIEQREQRYYMTEHELRLVSPELLGDVDFAPYIKPSDVYEPLLFLGRDTCMPLHYHGTTEALLCQLQGRKRIRLYAPDQFSRLYPPPWYAQSPLFSRVDGTNPDLDRFPKFKDAVTWDFMLEPGEILFIPVHWWHLTEVEGYQLSTTHFWRADLSCWTFPVPGLQICAREVQYQTKQGIGKAKARLRRIRSRLRPAPDSRRTAS